MSRRPAVRPLAHLAGLLCLAAAPAAMAAATFELRTISAQADWTTTPEEATLAYADWFNNGNLQTGGSYSGMATPATLYTLSGQAGLETTPGDYTTSGGDAVGQLRFTQAGASTPAAVSVNGLPFTDQNQRVRLNTSADGSLFQAGRAHFAAQSAWNFVAPDAGTRYGMRFSDGAFGDPAFNDVIALDVVHLASGETGVQLRRLSGDGASAVTVSDTQSFSVASGLTDGYSLADVDLVSLHLSWTASHGVVADAVLLHANNGQLVQVGNLAFSNEYAIFHGESGTNLQVGASWTTAAVPEPGSLALMLAGLGGVGALVRRRRPAAG